MQKENNYVVSSYFGEAKFSIYHNENGIPGIQIADITYPPPYAMRLGLHIVTALNRKDFKKIMKENGYRIREISEEEFLQKFEIIDFENLKINNFT